MRKEVLIHIHIHDVIPINNSFFINIILIIMQVLRQALIQMWRSMNSKERKKRIQEAKGKNSLVDCHSNLEQEGWSKIVEGQ